MTLLTFVDLKEEICNFERVYYPIEKKVYN